MKPIHSSLSFRFAALAGLVLGLLAPACADQANPVLPSTGGPGSVGAIGHSDAAEGEVGPMSDVADATLSPTSGSDAINIACDLLKQNCSTSGLGQGFGCYPVGGAGRCEAAGGIGAFGSGCTADTDCSVGLVCVSQSAGFNFGACQPICDMTDPTAANCVTGQVCQVMPGFDKATGVGRCNTP